MLRDWWFSVPTLYGRLSAGHYEVSEFAALVESEPLSIDPSGFGMQPDAVAEFFAANRERLLKEAIGEEAYMQQKVDEYNLEKHGQIVRRGESIKPGAVQVVPDPSAVENAMPIWQENMAYLFYTWRKEREKERPLFEIFRPGAEIANKAEIFYGPALAVTKGQDPFRAVQRERMEDELGQTIFGDNWIYFDPLV